MALWQAWAVLEAKQGDPNLDRHEVKINQEHRGCRNDPEQTVSVIRPQFGVGRYARRIIVGKAGQHARAENRQ